MALKLTSDEEMAALEAASSELKYLMAREGVSTQVQALFYHVGCTSISRFSAFCKTEDEMRDVAKKEFGLDPTANLKTRAEVASIVCAFKSAATRTDEVAKFQGEMDAKKLAVNLLRSVLCN